MTDVSANTGKLLEKYNVVTLTPGGGGEYPLQDGFGWTNGVAAGLFRAVPVGGLRIRRSCRSGGHAADVGAAVTPQM